MKIAIIGLGKIFEKHYLAISNIKKFKLVALCDNSPAAFKQYSKKYKKLKEAKFYRSIKNMIDENRLDVIIILTPSGYHGLHIKQCAKKIKNIIVEKPLCLSFKDHQKITKMIKRYKNNLLVVKQNRTNNTMRLAKKLVDKKDFFGKIKLVTTRVRWNRDLKYFKQAPWRGKWNQDGGVLLNQASHHLDLLCWLSKDKLSEVTAYGINFIKEIEAYDTIVGNIKFKSGLIGNVEVTTGILPKNLEGSISILGDKGSAIISGNNADKISHLYTKNKKYKKIFDQKNIDKVNLPNKFQQHYYFYKEAIDILKKRKKNTYNIEEAEKSIFLAHCCYKSAKLKKKIIVKKNNFIFDLLDRNIIK